VYFTIATKNKYLWAKGAGIFTGEPFYLIFFMVSPFYLWGGGGFGFGFTCFMQICFYCNTLHVASSFWSSYLWPYIFSVGVKVARWLLLRQLG